MKSAKWKLQKTKYGDNQKMFWLIFFAELVKMLFQSSRARLGWVLKLWESFRGCFWNSGGPLGVVFGAWGVVLGVLLETLVSFWIVLDPGRFQEPSGSMIAISFSRFWIDFGAILDLCWRSKSRKRCPKSISKTNQVLDIDFHEFWLILYGCVY